jgi:hypothetical protein
MQLRAAQSSEIERMCLITFGLRRAANHVDHRAPIEDALLLA